MSDYGVPALSVLGSALNPFLAMFSQLHEGKDGAMQRTMHQCSKHLEKPVYHK